ncbi:hypothetical protein CDD82_2077 [Ophiocordyceps australis]|uniref:Chromosome transmission fidelity protein 8 n=1 Tax=Ophiocordyceps australis TaxID=1399860 RepID=A0A2C5ZMS6_9HYPO|nr:hypothetical protein CDD82_2077 [Ophiocordyceps australis]
MTTVKLYPSASPAPSAVPSSLPSLLQTPSGLALVELQGEFNMPKDANGDVVSAAEIGTLHFPDYAPDNNSDDSAWMDRVHLYIGKHQRLTGQVKKLPRAIAVVRRRQNGSYESSGGMVEEQGDNIEVVEIVKYKLAFASRPEPVAMASAT